MVLNINYLVDLGIVRRHTNIVLNLEESVCVCGGGGCLLYEKYKKGERSCDYVILHFYTFVGKL